MKNLQQHDFEEMHWKDRYEYEAALKFDYLNSLTEAQLLKKIKKGELDFYFQTWYAIGKVGTLKNSWKQLWTFLKNSPGEHYMLDRYHCAAALFKLMGKPDPDCKNELRMRVQWDHNGEEERQKALKELKKVIQKILEK